MVGRVVPGGPFRVGILAFDGCFAAEIFGLSDLLLMANRVALASTATVGDQFEVSVLSAGGGPVSAAGGCPLGATLAHTGLDVLVVPGFEVMPGDDLDATLGAWTAETRFIAAAVAVGVPVASVCVGAFLLGEAGVLDGRRATTSWLFSAALASRFPDVSVTPEAIVVADDAVTTTAGFSAVHDLAIRLIRRHAGEQVARRTARVALVADNRTTQTPYVDDSMLLAPSSRFAHDVERRLLQRLDQPYDLGALSREFNVSTRTMLRRFAAEAGRSPLDFLQSARVQAAKRLLETDGMSVAAVMEQVGYRDAGTFRRLFTEQVGVTPAAYRRQFRAVGTR